ncbi:MAG: DUF1559 domain-containing protein [bacterium]|nr:DUF1559 domain-containing protein [bacterium]
MFHLQNPLRQRITCVAMALSCLASGSVAHAQQSIPAPPAPIEPAQFAQTTTVAVARIDPQALRLPEALEQAAKNSAGQESAWLQAAKDQIVNLLTAVGDHPVYVAVDIPSSQAQVPLRVFLKKTPQLNAESLPGGYEPYRRAIEQDGYLVVAPLGDIRESQQATANNKLSDDQAQAFSTAMSINGNAPIQIAVLPPEHLWRTLVELMPELPAELGGGPSSTLTEGMQWAGIQIDPSQLSFTATIQSSSENAAQAFAASLPKLLSSALAWQLEQMPEAARASLPSILEEIDISTAGSQVTIHSPNLFEDNGGQDLIQGWVNGLLAPISREGKMKKFKQLGLAVHNYESANRCLPPNQKGRGEDGSSWLSWRVHILPYLGEVELYQKFALDEPWDSEHNIQLLEEMPDVFKSYPSELLVPANHRPGFTSFLAPKGDKTIFGATSVVTLGKITDGTSNTLFFVDVKPELAVPWTAPQDYEFDPEAPAAGLQVDEAGVFVAGMADGSVHALPADLPAETLLHLFQMNDGHVVDWQQMH